MGKDLAGRFADLIQSGAFQLHLDAKTFPADTSIRFLQGDSWGASPRTRYGCLEGFRPVSAPRNASQDPLGCGRSTPFSGRCHQGREAAGKPPELRECTSMWTLVHLRIQTMFSPPRCVGRWSVPR